MQKTHITQCLQTLNYGSLPFYYIKTYTNEKIPVIGQLNVRVKYQQQKAALVFLVVVENEPTLLGRNWLQYIQLDWKTIHTVQHNTSPTNLNKLLNKFDELLSNILRKITNYEASLEIQTDIRPKIHEAWPLPFAIRPAIEEELDRLKAGGVIEKSDT